MRLQPTSTSNVATSKNVDDVRGVFPRSASLWRVSKGDVFFVGLVLGKLMIVMVHQKLNGTLPTDP